MPYTLDTSGLQALIQRLKQAQQTLPAVVFAGVQLVADETLAALVEATPYDPAPDNGVIPGEEAHLRDSYQLTPVELQAVQAECDLRTTEPIKFGYVTQGTLDVAPIYPVVKRGLWWPQLRHPVPQVAGQAPHPFQAPLPQEISDRMEDILAPVLSAWEQELTG
jgi:hypothetical protein